MKQGKFELRKSKQDIILLVICDFILVTLHMKYDIITIQEVALINMFPFFVSMVAISNVGLKNIDIFNSRNMIKILTFSLILVIFMMMPKTIIFTYSFIMFLYFILTIIFLLEGSKIQDSKATKWNKTVGNNYNEELITMFWRYGLRKAPKFKGNLKKENFKEYENFNIIIWAICSIRILVGGLGTPIEPLIIATIVITYIIFISDILYKIDKWFNNYVEINGICTGVITRLRKHEINHYIVSVVDFDNKIEKVIYVQMEDINNFRVGEKTRLIYGKLSKKVIFCN